MGKKEKVLMKKALFTKKQMIVGELLAKMLSLDVDKKTDTIKAKDVIKILDYFDKKYFNRKLKKMVKKKKSFWEKYFI